MANICSDKVIFYNDRYQQGIKRLSDDVEQLFHLFFTSDNWIGKLLELNELPNPEPLNGLVINYEAEDDHIMLDLEVDFKPLINVYRKIARQYGLSFVLRSEEYACCIYVNTDKSGRFFPDKYIAHIGGDMEDNDESGLVRAMDHEDQKYKKLDGVLEFFSEFGFVAASLYELNRMLAKKEIDIRVYRYTTSYRPKAGDRP